MVTAQQPIPAQITTRGGDGENIEKRHFLSIYLLQIKCHQYFKLILPITAYNHPIYITNPIRVKVLVK